MTFQVGKQDRDYKKIFGVIAGATTIFGTLGFTALVIEGFYTVTSPIFFDLVWITVGCMVGGLASVKIYRKMEGKN